jgi:hypothetical protein
MQAGSISIRHTTPAAMPTAELSPVIMKVFFFFLDHVVGNHFSITH